MEQEKIQNFKKMLEEELQTLKKELSDLGRKNPDNQSDWEAMDENNLINEADSGEVADEIESYEENTAVLKNLEIRYNEVKCALQRIENGKYGICEVGNEPIEIERLEANPAARTCKQHLNG